MIKQLRPQGEKLQVFYEAGPRGYGLYHQIRAKGQSCTVIAPSLIPHHLRA